MKAFEILVCINKLLSIVLTTRKSLRRHSKFFPGLLAGNGYNIF